MDWFEKLTGFRERDWIGTRKLLTLDGSRLISRTNDASYGIGDFELISLGKLREQCLALNPVKGTAKLNIEVGDVRRMHQLRANQGALFQVASQFNMLEMVGPSVTPEDGVTIYENDHTQGPACAIAAGAATIYRNYFLPINGASGQTATRQVDVIRLPRFLRTRVDKTRDQRWAKGGRV